MAAKSLKKSPPPPAHEQLSARQASTLCAERQKLDDERLALGRQADALKKQIDAIDAELFSFVEANKYRGVRTVDLPKWRLSIVAVQKSVYWLRELTSRIGQAAIDELRASAGTKDVLQIESK